jgi:prefoldin subunit 5
VRNAMRTAERRVSELEARIESTESRIAELTRELEDPELYTTPDGVSRAAALGVELETRRRELEQTLAQWSTASEALESLSAGSS